MVEEKKKTQNLIVKTNTVIGSTYSQIARVTVSDYEITIEFAYVHPADPAQGHSVARVTMPIAAGRELAQTILSLDKIHKKRKKRKPND